MKDMALNDYRAIDTKTGVRKHKTKIYTAA